MPAKAANMDLPQRLGQTRAMVLPVPAVHVTAAVPVLLHAHLLMELAPLGEPAPIPTVLALLMEQKLVQLQRLLAAVEALL